MGHLLKQSMPYFKLVSNSPCMWRNIFYPSSMLKQCRTFSIGKCALSNYEGDGRTTVTILNKEHSSTLMINSYSTAGFRLNNGIFATGPIAIFPKTILHWNVKTVSDITAETVSLFTLLVPKIDILILGTGEKRLPLSLEVEKLLKSKGLYPEILPTDQACNIFNFLNVEGRSVAGGFIPPTFVVTYQDEFELIQAEKDIDVFK